MKLNSSFLPYIKINSRWIKYLNVKRKLITLSKDNIGKYIYGLRLGKNFFIEIEKNINHKGKDE